MRDSHYYEQRAIEEIQIASQLRRTNKRSNKSLYHSKMTMAIQLLALAQFEETA